MLPMPSSDWGRIRHNLSIYLHLFDGAFRSVFSFSVSTSLGCFPVHILCALGLPGLWTFFWAETWFSFSLRGLPWSGAETELCGPWTCVCEGFSFSTLFSAITSSLILWCFQSENIYLESVYVPSKEMLERKCFAAILLNETRFLCLILAAAIFHDWNLLTSLHN